MSEPRLGFGARLALALRILFDGELAGRFHAASADSQAPQLPPPAVPPPAPAAPAAPQVERAAADEERRRGAMHMLAILQREGRLIDFLQEDMSHHSDAAIGGAARVVHEGCRKALHQCFELQAVREEEEGASVTVEPGFDPLALQLTGNVRGQPPFRGTLAHPGWQVVEVRLPIMTNSGGARILAPAEVEI